jgi:hypothetical protein
MHFFVLNLDILEIFVFILQIFVFISGFFMVCSSFLMIEKKKLQKDEILGALAPKITSFYTTNQFNFF